MARQESEKNSYGFIKNEETTEGKSNIRYLFQKIKVVSIYCLFFGLNSEIRPYFWVLSGPFWVLRVKKNGLD